MPRRIKHIDVLLQVYSILEEYAGNQFDTADLLELADELISLSKRKGDPYKLDARGAPTHFSAEVDRMIKSDNFHVFCNEFNFNVVFEGENELVEGHRRFLDITNQ